MTHLSDTARQYSRNHAERFRHELDELLRIPSVSADPDHARDVERAANWLAGHLDVLGAERVQGQPEAW